MNDVQRFLASPPFAVVGASTDRSKFGNRVLRCYLRHGLPVTPVHPRAETVEGLLCYASLAEIPEPPGAISIITQPAVTERVVAEALELGIGNIWMQPGAESEDAVQAAEAGGANVIAGGPCILVELGE